MRCTLKQNLVFVLVFVFSVFFFEGCKGDGGGDDKKTTDMKDAQATLERFFANAKLEYIPGVTRPQLPSVDPRTSEALAVIRKTEEKEYLADIAAIIVEYDRINWRDHGHGAHLDPKNELVITFTAKMNLERISDDERISTGVVHWIREFRERLGPSKKLDEEILEWLELERKKDAEFRDLLKEKGDKDGAEYSKYLRLRDERKAKMKMRMRERQEKLDREN